MKGRTGTTQHYEFRMPRIRRGLALALGGGEPTPRVPLKPDPRLRRIPVSPDDPITDLVLAHMRWDRETLGMTAKQIATKYALPRAQESRIYKLLDYQSRAHVMPLDPELIVA